MINEYVHKTSTVRVPVDVALTRPPGHRREWTAEAASCIVSASTERAALDTFGTAVAAFLRELRPPVVIMFGGFTSVVSVQPSADGPSWRTDTFGPDGRDSGGSFTGDGWDNAERRARYSLVQRLTDLHDDTSVHAGAAFLRTAAGPYGADALYQYAAWQRAARHAMQAGMGDGYHEWASRNADRFAVPRP